MRAVSFRDEELLNSIAAKRIEGRVSFSSKTTGPLVAERSVPKFSSKASRTTHHGFAQCEIDAPTRLVFAWLCDDKFEKGIRENYEISWKKSETLEVINDHSFIDFRSYPLAWPMKPRCVTLRHLRKELPDGTCVSLATSVDMGRNDLEALLARNGSGVLPGDAIFAQYHAAFVVTSLGESRCKLEFWACELRAASESERRTHRVFCVLPRPPFSDSDPKGDIPSWVLKSKIPDIMGVVTNCKAQLDAGILNAKRQTYSERMERMRKRVAIKWSTYERS